MMQWQVEWIATRRLHVQDWFCSEIYGVLCFLFLGNTGDDAEKFIKKFNPRFVILEPVKMYYDILLKKFNGNSK